MRSHRWPAFQEGRWGNRFNPPIPEGDVRPPGKATAAQTGLCMIQLPPATLSGSPVVPVDQPSASAQPVQGFVPSSDREELADEGMELTVSASPPRTTAPRQTPSHAKVAEAVTNMVAHMRKNGAPAASTVTSSQKGSQVSGTSTKDSTLGRIPRLSTKETDPPRASSSHHGRSGRRDRARPDRTPVFLAHETTLRWTAPGAQPHWREEEPESLGDIEESVRQVAGGATEVATDNLIRFMAGVHARLDESMQSCMRELRDARSSASRFGPPGPVQQLMGKVQHVWDHAGMKQNRINALEGEKDQAREQCDKMATAQTTAQQEIGQLQASNEQLQKENERLRQELLAAKATPRPAGPPSVSSDSSHQSGLTEQEQIRHLTATVTRIRGEREALRRENEKFKAANEKWRTDAIKEKQRNARTINDMYNRWKEAEERVKRAQASSNRLPSHQEMGSHIYLSAAEGQASHSAATADPQGPPVLPTPLIQPARLGATGSPQAPQLTPHRSASETSQETLGREEAMESDSLSESESQEQ